MTEWKLTKHKLTEKEMELLNDINACGNACEKIIRKIVREYELSEIQQTVFWNALKKKYKLDVVNLEHKIVDGEIYSRDISANKFESLVRELEIAPQIREKVFATFGVDQGRS